MIYRTIGKQRRWMIAAAVAVVVAGAGTAVALAATGGGSTTDGTAHAATTTSVDTRGFPSGGRNPGIFTDRCAFSHEAADDPILAPGRPGTSMHHEFFGNTTTSASSTAAKLVGGKTTCSTTADASGYWVPVLYQNGKAVQPKSALIYWRQTNTLAKKVQPMPAGLTMIAGNEAATAPQSRSVVQWSCQTGRSPVDKHRSTAPPSCSNTDVKVTIFFPSCWDGHTLDGASQTNVVYPGTGGCPSSHPVEIPQVVFHTTYAITDPTHITLSMTPTMAGSTNTEHADFVNGWTQTTLTADTTACIKAQTRCGGVQGATATPKGPNKRQLMKQRKHHRTGH